MNKERDYIADYLKFFAAILITNSHLSTFDVNYRFATGGSLGDVIFLFCSGYTLFLGEVGRLDNWYKRRLMRIFPPVVCWGLLSSIFFENNSNFKSILIYGGGWFVQCILIYYIFAYFIRKYAINYIKSIFTAIALLSIILVSTISDGEQFNIYGWNYYKWMIFFLVFIIGAMFGRRKRIDSAKCGVIKAFVILISTVVAWYGILYCQKYFQLHYAFQLLSVIPLCYFPIILYKFLAISRIKYLLEKKYINLVILNIGGLCYEIYLVQSILLHRVQNYFSIPLSIVYIWLLILFWAYMLHIFTKLCIQTFTPGNYDWKQIFKIV